MTDDLPAVRSQFPVQEEHEAALGKLDTTGAWAACGLDGAPSEYFEADLREALKFHRSGPDRYAALPAKQRNALYNRLEKSIETIVMQFEEMNDFITFEIDVASNYFGPEDENELRALLSDDYEGLSYGSYQIHSIRDHLTELREVIAYARASHARRRGKPKQNRTLERTIASLAKVYNLHTGKDPMARYRYNDWSGEDEAQVYHGPFFDFLHCVFWSMYGRENPTSHVLGHAAREVFKREK